MSIQISIQATNAHELRGHLIALGALAGAPVNYANYEPAVEPPLSAPEALVEDVTQAALDTLDTVEPQDKPKRGRGRPRKAAQPADGPAQSADEPAEAGETQEIQEPEAAETGSEPAANPFAEEAADAAVRDPKVDWGLALELLREVYDRKGAAAAVNAILTEYAVAKFTSIPKEKGTELLTKARALDAEYPA